MDNASLLKQGMERAGFSCFGGTGNPYAWVKAPQGNTSWQFFDLCHQNKALIFIDICKTKFAVYFFCLLLA